MGVKKEVSTTGGVAGYNSPIGAPGNPTPEELKRWKKEKRRLLDKGKKKKAAFRKERARQFR